MTDNNMSHPKVFAIILNYNGKDFLLSCIESLYKSDYPNLEIVVVDNNSTDGSLEDAREKFSRLHFIKNSENMGFAAGNNVAIRFALEKMADYVFLLNNDAVVEPDAISKLVTEAGKDSSGGVWSPVILSWDKSRVWFAGGDVLWDKMKTFHITTVPSDSPYQTGYVSGCAILIKKDVFKKIGLFDERFFLYYEDADFSHQAKKAGFKLIIIPSAIAYHAEQSEAENPSKLYWLVLSGIIFFKKNFHGSKGLWIAFYLMLRKFKNSLDLFAKNDEKKMNVRRAYRNYKKFLR